MIHFAVIRFLDSIGVGSRFNNPDKLEFREHLWIKVNFRNRVPAKFLLNFFAIGFLSENNEQITENFLELPKVLSRVFFEGKKVKSKIFSFFKHC